MKYGVPIGVLVLIGIAVVLHPTPIAAKRVIEEIHATADRQGSSIASPASAESVGTQDPGLLLLKQAELPMKGSESGSAVVPPVKTIAWRKLSISLERSLELSPLQKDQVDGILREREEEIRTWHEEIRRSGVLDIRTYEWKVGLLKASWYQRVDSLLDAIQHQRFVSLVEQGLFNEGLAFTVEPGMTVLE